MLPRKTERMAGKRASCRSRLYSVMATKSDDRGKQYRRGDSVRFKRGIPSDSKPLASGRVSWSYLPEGVVVHVWGCCIGGVSWRMQSQPAG